MKFSLGIIQSILLVTTGFAQANETRMSRLADSSLIERLEQDGAWEIEVFDTKIEYSCLKCDGKVEATIEVIAPYEALQHVSSKARYLSERKSHCANLAINNSGRCIETSEIGYRAGLLSGFISQYTVYGNAKIEVVFFYREWQQSPELIKGTMTDTSDSDLPNDLQRLFVMHMAKLTNLY